MELKVIAHMKSDFPTKFALPRQSGLVDSLRGKIIFEREYSAREAFRGICDFSHIWIIWGFSEAKREGWSPTVRPPRLGGNKRMGVFSTRSPYRPNSIGLSCVRLISFDIENGCAVLTVQGGDLMDGTPIYDIKPYLPFTDSRPDARGGFADTVFGDRLTVDIPEEIRTELGEEMTEQLYAVLRSDPRPSYQDDPDREYGFLFSEYEIKFKVNGSSLTVLSANRANNGDK